MATANPDNGTPESQLSLAADMIFLP